METHLLVAAAMWSGIGIYLVVRGLLLYRAGNPLYLPAAVLLGTVKSLLVLDRAARKNIQRLLAFEDGTCLGGVYSWRMWGLVVAMMVAGRFLRTSHLSGQLVGLVYVTVGWGLFLSSRLLWRQWRP